MRIPRTYAESQETEAGLDTSTGNYKTLQVCLGLHYVSSRPEKSGLKVIHLPGMRDNYMDMEIYRNWIERGMKVHRGQD